MFQRATYMRDGSLVPRPGHIQDVREATAVPGAPAEKVGCRLVSQFACQQPPLHASIFIPLPLSSCPPPLLFPFPPLLFPPLPFLSLSVPTHLHKGVISMTWLMFVKMHHVRKKLKTARAQHLERHQRRARVSP